MRNAQKSIMSPRVAMILWGAVIIAALAMCALPRADNEPGVCRSTAAAQADLRQRIRRDLRDPSSFQHVRTEQSGRRLQIEYRAANGYGGLNAGSASATLDENCRLMPGSIRIS